MDNPTDRGSLEQPPASAAPSGRTVAALLIALFSVYALSTGGHTYSSDEEGIFQTTRSLARFEYAIDIWEDNRSITPHRVGRNGEMVGVSGIGQSVIALPFFLAGKVAALPAPAQYREVVVRLFTMWTNSLVTAVNAVFVFLIAYRLGAQQRSSILLALVYGLGTMAWPHAKTLFTEPTAALSLLGASYVAIADRASTRWRPLVSGSLVGLGMLVRVANALFIPVVGLYVVATRFLNVDRRSAIHAAIAFGFGVGGAAVLLGAINWWRYGSPVDLGYLDVPLHHPVADGLWGLFFSPGKSVFLYAPIALVAVAALPWSFRRRPGETALFVGLLSVNALFYARLPFWHGDQAYGPRYMQITLPFFVLLVAPVLRQRAHRLATAVAGIVGFLGPALLGTLVFFNTYFAVARMALGTELVDGQYRFLRATHETIRWSPIVGHAQLLDDAVVNTVQRIDGRDASITTFPEDSTNRYHSYDWPPQVDAWWARFPAIGAPPAYLALTAPLLTSAVWGFRVLVRQASSTCGDGYDPTPRTRSAR